MKKLFLSYIILSLATPVFAQKKVLDHTVYDQWKYISSSILSKKGNIAAYETRPQEGDGVLAIHFLKKDSKLIIPRGYNIKITPNEKYAVCLIKPLYSDTRNAKIKKVKSDKMPKDSLAVIDLTDRTIKKFKEISSYSTGEIDFQSIALLSSDTTFIPKEERKKKSITKTTLLVLHLAQNHCDTLRHVDKYAFDKKGKFITALVSDQKDKTKILLYDNTTRQTDTLTENKAYHSLPTFNEESNKLLYLASEDSTKTGDKRCELFQYDLLKKESKCLIHKNYQTNLPENWGINQNSNPFFSQNSNHIYLGIAPIRAPKDTTIVPFETASLDLWNYIDDRIPPTQLVNLQKDLNKTYLAIYKEDPKGLMPLTTSFFDHIELINKGNASIALSVDETGHVIEKQWDVQNTVKLSIINLKDGSRTIISSGKYTQISSSPSGKYIIWYDLPNKQWHLFDIAKNKTLCLTASCKVAFWDEKSDIPSYPEPYGIAGWTNNDKDVLIYDQFDIWKFSTDNATAVNLTQGEGRQTNRTFRYLNPKSYINKINPKYDYISLEKPLLLDIFDHTTKKHGIASLNMRKKRRLQIPLLDHFTFSSLRKAEEADIYIYQKSNFQTSPNIYTTSTLWETSKQLSDINPQMKDYNWGTAELYKWNAYDGTPLEGLLYKPEDFDPTKKYPVIIYFYERRSDNLYSYYAPSPSRSTINIPFFCSRGYLVFVPDIVYNTGIPGECAYNCIVSGSEALAQNSWVDKGNMAIQGQSWGGYQVAYLITRTNLFKAAGAGAPVSNMTSAYGGIRWGTGISRQFQYEHTQSRIGQTLWASPELYIANSPLFKADHVETPLLIMHNDKDGAVPWYQGIEYFMALRRLGKKVWMLQYNNEDHNLKERRNMKDLSIRLQQFFDYYLKAAPMPAWMNTGIPSTRKGEYFGTENAE
ncbi:MAG: alpha/beta hydrolase family protein [Bacteroides sp.]